MRKRTGRRGAAAGKKTAAKSAKENARLLEMGHNVTSPVHQGLSMHTLSAYKKTREFTASCPQASHFKQFYHNNPFTCLYTDNHIQGKPQCSPMFLHGTFQISGHRSCKWPPVAQFPADWQKQTERD
ncbi:MAG: hypothetical protein KH196_00320 [Oscillospiraceae bacterium]|nr:hypothetical protein [Oscillospiraceae bacterium]